MIFSDEDKIQLTHKIEQRTTNEKRIVDAEYDVLSHVRDVLLHTYSLLEAVVKELPDIWKIAGKKPTTLYKSKGIFSTQIELIPIGLVYNISWKIYADLNGDIVSAFWKNEKPHLFKAKSQIHEYIEKHHFLTGYRNNISLDTGEMEIHFSNRHDFQDLASFLLSIAYNIFPVWDGLLEDYSYKFIFNQEKNDLEQIAAIKQAVLFHAGSTDSFSGFNSIYTHL